jgi:hypothetical protein
MGDAEFGEAILFRQDEWFYKTFHRGAKKYPYSACIVLVIYYIMLWDSGLMCPSSR